MASNTKEFRAALGLKAGQSFPAYAWPGGYPVIYHADDCETICPKCVNKESQIHFDEPNDGWRVIGWDIHWEGPAEHCAHCNAAIESAYGDPEAEQPTTDDER